MSNHKRFLPLIRLMDADHKCYALDFPGSGFSQDIDSYHSIETLSDIAGRLMDHAGGDDFVIIGHSMGGAVAQLVALENIKRTRALILINPVPFSGFKDFYDQREYIASMYRNRGLLREIFDQSFPAYQDQTAIEEMIDDAFNSSWRVFTDEPKAMSEFNIADRIHSLTTPALLLYSDNDQIIKPQEIKNMPHALPNCKSVMFSGYGHSPHFEAPDKVHCAITKFISDLGL